MHLSRNMYICSRKSGEGGGHMKFLIKGRNFKLRVEWERVDMEENNMRATTIDDNTQ